MIDLLMSDETWLAVAVGLTCLLIFLDGLAIGFIVGKNFPYALDDETKEANSDV
ncbi:MAG: hypothetical protein WC734_06085 [Patescibacteria group bacterium]|jgi:hypothetical protein